LDSKTPAKKYKPDTIRAAFSKFFETGEESAEGEIRMYCPIDENPLTSKTPSASINPEAGVWNCMKGNHGGSIYHLVQDLKKHQNFDIRSEALKGRNQDSAFQEAREAGIGSRSKGGTPLPSQAQIEDWSQRLLKSSSALSDLITTRGLNKTTIANHSIGWDGQRYTIPVFDADGELLNVRRYKLHAARSQDKMLNIAGHGSAQIYCIDLLLNSDTVVLTEGEMDCLLLNQFGIPAITHTAGAKTFRPQWGPLFAGKVVYICYDNDEAGHIGASKARDIISAFAEVVYLVKIPIEGADITNYLHDEGHTVEEFRELMEAAAEHSLVNNKIEPLAESGRTVSLTESMNETFQNEILETTVSVSGKQAEPYTAPRTIIASCDMSKGAACQACPVAFRNGTLEMEIRPDDEDLFRFVDVPETRRRTLLKEITGARCTDRVEFEVPEDYHVEELLVQPSVDARNEDETELPIRRTVYSVSSYRTAVNEKMRIVGRNVPDPKNGKLRFMSWVNERVDMDIDKFELTEEMVDRLRIFQPTRDQTPLDKCIEIAQDLAENVTHIYGRDALHVAYDLVWHSVQSFRIFDFTVDKGWLEMMVVGDTRTGKSEIATRLIRHYRSGDMISCEGMSFAGLVGGVQQIDNRWHLTWGIVPMNDRRLVVLDEVSGLAEKNVIEQMSSIRSSGIAQITKIQSEQTSARTRLIWIGNPANGGMLSSSSDTGMWALRSLVPASEDIARFDFVAAAAKDEVPAKMINAGFAERHEPIYRSNACEELVKWAWSLKRDDVVFSEQAVRKAVEAANDLGERYVSDPPLIQTENVRFKVLRVAAAIAARTFSINKKRQLYVKLEHVVSAVTFLDMVYGSEAMGYQRRSRRQIAAAKAADSRRAVTKVFLLDKGENLLFALRSLGTNVFRVRDLTELLDNDEKMAVAHIKRLTQWKMVHRKTRGEFVMDQTLISLLREIEDDEDMEELE
jgi:hypothetical protein